jgi:hypothetical protein
MGYGDGFLRVYLNTKWSCINGFLAMDEAAGKKIGSWSVKKTLNG